MARIRTIKPEFCSSADTGALSRDARLFFLQLLTEADDDGRMLWLARKLAGVLYPRDEMVGAADLNAWADECVKRGMLKIYEISGVQYLQVVNWSKHQKISHPTPSRLPACPLGDSGKSPEEIRNNTGDAQEPPDNETESLRSDLGTGNREQGEGKGEKPSSTALQSTPATNPADLNQHKAARLDQVTEDAITAFNATLGKPVGLLPAVHRTVGRDKRRKEVGRCVRLAREICQDQYGSSVITLEFWRAYFGSCADDPFKSGRTPPGKEHSNWVPTFEYLTREATMLEVFDKSGAGEADAA